MKETQVNTNDYSKEELIKMAETFGLNTFPNAERPTQPTKQEIVDHIRESIAKGTKVTEEKPAVKKADKGLTKKARIAKKLKEAMAQKRVIITQLHNPARATEEITNRVDFRVWGNSVMGYKKYKVVYDTPWMLPVGLINNLKSIKHTKMVKDLSSNEGHYKKVAVNVYKIDDIGLPTKEELAVISKRQALLKALG